MDTLTYLSSVQEPNPKDHPSWYHESWRERDGGGREREVGREGERGGRERGRERGGKRGRERAEGGGEGEL